MRRMGCFRALVGWGAVSAACVGWAFGVLSGWTALAVLGTVAAVTVAVGVRSAARMMRFHAPAEDAIAAYLDRLAAPDAGGADREWLSPYADRITEYTVLGVTLVGPGPPHAEAHAIVCVPDGRMLRVLAVLTLDEDGRWCVAAVSAVPAKSGRRPGSR